MRDAGEAGLEGWEIEVSELTNNGFEPVAQSTTDSDGTAVFNNLLPGSYFICEIQQDGWVQSQPANDDCWQVELQPGQDIQAPFGNAQKSTVTLTKFHDTNQNGFWDDGEEALEGWDLTLTGDDGSDVVYDQTLTTDQNGEAIFTLLHPGLVYTATETLQDGWTQTNIYCERDPLFSLNPGFFNNLDPAILAGLNLDDDTLDLLTNALLDPSLLTDDLLDSLNALSISLGDEGGLDDNQLFLLPGQSRHCYVGNYERTIDVTLTTSCGSDFPYLNWTVQSTFLPTQITIEWYTTDNNDAGDPADTLVFTHTFTPDDAAVTTISNTAPLYEYQGTVLWPGSSDDPNNPSWTGYEQVNGQWQPNPNVNYGNLRPQARIDVTVNPTETAVVEYPLATDTCDPNPSNPEQVLGTSTDLANTGDNTGLLSVVVGVMLLILVAAARRTHTTTV